MKTHPILFSAPMILALLAGKKTQTRRALRAQPMEHADTPRRFASGNWLFHYDNQTEHRCPYGKPGDLLYVRENMYEDSAGSISFAAYSADNCTSKIEWWKPTKHCPSIHQPRRASRMTLRITDVRVERVQDISPSDAVAEGIPNGAYAVNSVESYRQLWNSINNNWDDNPWVWVVEFEVIHQNVDAVIQ